MADVWTDERLDAALDALGRRARRAGRGHAAAVHGRDGRRAPLAVGPGSRRGRGRDRRRAGRRGPGRARYGRPLVRRPHRAGRRRRPATGRSSTTPSRSTSTPRSASRSRARGARCDGARPSRGGGRPAGGRGAARVATTARRRCGCGRATTTCGREAAGRIGGRRARLAASATMPCCIEGDHVLDTPSRRVAAGRVLWWLDDGRQWRLESDLDAPAMLDIARALAS